MTFEEWYSQSIAEPGRKDPLLIEPKELAGIAWTAALREAAKLLCVECECEWTPEVDGRHYDCPGEIECIAWPLHQMLAEMNNEES